MLGGGEIPIILLNLLIPALVIGLILIPAFSPDDPGTGDIAYPSAR